MYQIIDHDTGVLITETLNITWLKQQERVDIPILAHNFNEADGVAIIINGEEKTFGIKKARDPDAPNMDNYTPLVKVVEVSGEPYIFRDLDTVKRQGTDAGTQLNAQQQLQLAGMQGQSDTYAAILAMQETINAQQQLILANMQGLSDVYATLLALQTNSTDA